MFENQLFSFTRAERRGLLFFLFLSVSIWLAFKFYKYTFCTPLRIQDMRIATEIESEAIANLSANKSSSELEDPFSKNTEIHRFPFDPNKISYDSLRLIGFSKLVSKNVVKYREKGGVFRSRDKLAAIYGMDTTFLRSLDPLIAFPASDQSVEKNKVGAENYRNEGYPKKVKPISFLKVELNSADSLEILALDGIGPSLCRRLLKYRRRLGGFLSVSQLYELEVLQDTLLQKLDQSIWVNPEYIQKIDINTSGYQEFKHHPYFSYQEIQAILQYRKQHGPFEKVEHIRRIRSITAERGEKMIPYLNVVSGK